MMSPRLGSLAKIRPLNRFGLNGIEHTRGHDTDLEAIEEGYVAVTPLQLDLTHHASLGALAAAHPRRVRLVRRYVDEVELKTLMLGCSGMVFNYQAARYADQTSGVLWQAAAAGLPVWCVGESWLTREARRLLPGGVEVVSDPAALVAALESAFRIGASTSTAKREPEPLQEQEREAQTAYRTALFQPLAGFLLDQLHRCAQKPPLARLADPRFAPQPGSHDPAAPLALVIDERPPAPVRSAGHHAAWQEMLLLSAIGMRVCVGSTSHEAIEPGIEDELAAQGTEWVGAAKELAGFLQRHGSAIGIVYLTRFHVAERVLPWVRKTAPQARVLLNLADLHHLRIEREARLYGKADLLRHAAAIQARECAVMAQVDTVLTYTEEEATLIHAQMQGRVDVQRLPWVDKVRHGTTPGPQTRRDLLFVGALSHAPNVDALLWFAKEVMPLLRQRLPGVRLRVCGSDPTVSIQALQGPDILIEGFVEDLEPVYDACRLFVAPLRFGAGIKGKVAAALGAGLPVVASPVAAEGFVEAGTMGVAAIAQTPQQWCEYIALLFLNEQAWQRMSMSASAYASKRLSWEVGMQAMHEICKPHRAGLQPLNAVATSPD